MDSFHRTPKRFEFHHCGLYSDRSPGEDNFQICPIPSQLAPFSHELTAECTWKKRDIYSEMFEFVTATAVRGCLGLAERVPVLMTCMQHRAQAALLQGCWGTQVRRR